MESIHVYTDGASRSNPGQAAIAFCLCTVTGQAISADLVGSPNPYAETIGIATNNEAEYRALIAAAKTVLNHTLIQTVVFHSDSELMIKQLKGLYKIKSSGLLPLFTEAKLLLSKIAQVSFVHVPRTHPNIQRCDREANRSLDQETF